MTRPERRKQIVRGIAWGLLLLAAGVSMKFWMTRRQHAIAALDAIDSAAAQRAQTEVATLLLSVVMILTLLGAVWAILFALRALRAGRWPLPGARVYRETRVIGGWCLWLRFALPIPILIAALAVLAWSGAQVLAMLHVAAETAALPISHSNR